PDFTLRPRSVCLSVVLLEDSARPPPWARGGDALLQHLQEKSRWIIPAIWFCFLLWFFCLLRAAG
ncbi:MAG: hypothetical protein ACKPKO_24945, partial [Candidatus Fonsibacter sp.]